MSRSAPPQLDHLHFFVPVWKVSWVKFAMSTHPEQLPVEPHVPVAHSLSLPRSEKCWCHRSAKEAKDFMTNLTKCKTGKTPLECEEGGPCEKCIDYITIIISDNIYIYVFDYYLIGYWIHHTFHLQNLGEQPGLQSTASTMNEFVDAALLVVIAC